jgi:hypothetical protein
MSGDFIGKSIATHAIKKRIQLEITQAKELDTVSRLSQSLVEIQLTAMFGQVALDAKFLFCEWTHRRGTLQFSLFSKPLFCKGKAIAVLSPIKANGN